MKNTVPVLIPMLAISSISQIARSCALHECHHAQGYGSSEMGLSLPTHYICMLVKNPLASHLKIYIVFFFNKVNIVKMHI